MMTPLARPMRGMSLIETLIALTVLAIGLTAAASAVIYSSLSLARTGHVEEASMLAQSLSSALSSVPWTAQLSGAVSPFANSNAGNDGDVCGAEALLRWEHPERGVLLPADFIPAAERTGLIIELGRWVLAEAAEQAVRWRDCPPMTISVNVSTQQLAQGDFATEVASILEMSGLPASSLRLEVTESAVLDTVRLAPTWTALDAMGVRLHVDAFGSTSSSLRHLIGLPVDTVTIDPSFVAGLGTDSQDSAIVEAVVHLADALHLQSMGEGVETEQQAVLLRSIGCTLGQGYYFARPQPAEAVEELIGKRAR